MEKNYECKDGVCYLRRPTKKTDKKIIPLPNDSDEWTVYGAKWCEYCKKATELLEKNNLTFVYHDVDDFGSDNIKEQLKDLTNNQKTIPIIFNGNKFIGGYSDLCAFDFEEKKENNSENTEISTNNQLYFE
jgi:glutaredoxin|tara:strand:- start:85 stop:477 length:393 start_codon:yes stop_codon:yes gene_type:complete